MARGPSKQATTARVVWADAGTRHVFPEGAPDRRTQALRKGHDRTSDERDARCAELRSVAEHDGPDSEIVNKIKELLDTRVRPAVAQDGGDITFHGYESGIVYLHMQGACAGCPSSTMTLKMGIENLLKHFIPEVQEVRPIAA